MGSAVTNRKISERQLVAAELLGRCVDRREILKATGLRRKATLSEWLTDPLFQQAVSEANRNYISELREMKRRIIAQSLELIEEELKNVESNHRIDIAFSIVRTVI